MLNKKMLICGEWKDSESKKQFDVINPANGSVVGKVPLATRQDMVNAIEFADRECKNWSHTNPFQRGSILRKASDIVRSQVEEIANVMSAEQGKTKNEATQEVMKGAEILRYYAEEGERIYGKIITNQNGMESHVIYQPLGVCGSISPWNYPVELLAWKLGAALASGCSIICKLPYETPLSPLLFVECIAKAGAPAGCLQVLTGHGAELGPVLVSNPKVKKIAFTGSTAVGKTLMQSNGGTVKRFSLELGGNLPVIICDDCDIDKAVEGTIRRSFRNLGQVCIAINRVYVQRGIYENFLKKLVEKTNFMTIGDPAKGEFDCGAMCTKRGLKKVIEHVEDARSKGARILVGGEIPSGAGYDGGLFYPPTVIADADHNMLIMKEETFGPAVGVMPFDTLDEAIALANDTQYGLAAICYTSSINNARRVSTEIEAGNIAINNVDAGVINAPYGGWKDSGFGHEHGPEGIYEYLNIKHIRYNFN